MRAIFSPATPSASPRRCARRRSSSAGLTKGKTPEQLRKDAAAKAADARLQDGRQAGRRRDRRQSKGRRQLAATCAHRRQGRRRAGTANATNCASAASTAAYAAYERLTAPGAASRGPGASRRSFCAPGNVASLRSTPIARASTATTTSTSARPIEDLREKYGFRITDYKVDNDSAAPRVCFQFSEPLARKTDFAPYVAVSGAANTADQHRRAAALRRGPETWRALRHRRAPGPALDGRRIPAQERRL